MKLTFVGVGDATDPALGSSCYLLESHTKLLVDCGLGAPGKLLTPGFSVEFLDAIYFTHFHADHIFGVVGLLISLSLEGRTSPLTILGQPGTGDRVAALMELGYPGRIRNLGFELKFIETVDPIEINELRLSFAETDHPMRNYAVKIEHGELKIGISGDGAMTDGSRALFRDCQILVHESFGIDETLPGHTSAAEVLAESSQFKALKLLALVHLNKALRRSDKERYHSLARPYPFKTIIPEPGVQIDCESSAQVLLEAE